MTAIAIWSCLTAVILLRLTSLVKPGNAAVFGNESDRLALLSFKAMITEDPYNILNSWNDSLHFCEWEGVSCSLGHQRVTLLDLQSRRLVGSISLSIANLTFLRWISLGDNGFHGEIPSEIGLLFHLRHINLSYNSLEFEIPTNLTRLSNLQHLDLCYNKLVGRIPAELRSCQNLMHIDLSNNNLTGSIPPFLGNLSSLENLFLRYYYLEGSIPQDLGQLVQLKKLLVEANSLSGTVPSSIYNLSTLVFLGLSVNQLQGGLPPDLGITLPRLQALGVAANSFTGPLPSTLVNASLFFWLDCTNSNFTGNLPANLGSLARLTHFSVGYNNLESTDLRFLTSLTNCTNLGFLVLSHNHFRGHFPESISNLSTKLTTLNLGFNEIRGFIPSGISKLDSLVTFVSENNWLTGNIPSSIGKLQKLQYLDLTSNKLLGPIPSSIGNLSNIYAIYLSNNSLSGSIPWSIRDSQSLQILHLGQNNLSGVIPKHLPVKLGYLNLSYNSFSYPLLMEVQSMVSLKALDVSGNQISGQIPSTISNCVKLRHLILAGNNFQGTIPSTLSSLKDVVVIDLSRNHLKGNIPDFLCNLPSLKYLDLSFNEFEGEVPKRGLVTNTYAFFVQGNRNACGGASQLKLPPCRIQGSPTRKKSSTLLAALTTCAVVLCVVILLSICALCYTRKPRKRTFPAAASNDGHWLLKLTCDDIRKATDGFCEANLIGSGSYGSVYKGNISGEETTIAVKVLNLQHPSAYRTFAAECEALRMIRHRNIVKILTCCSMMDYKGNSFLALVLEFMSKGSLEEWLHEKKLNITQRLNIAVDVASALDYLHHHCQNPIVHCDLKPSNILLDDNMCARISDFGLARMLPYGTYYETSSISVKGTVGYAPPEYGLVGEASTKGDVYSYGIILLELFTGKRPTDGIFRDDCDLHNFVKIAVPERIREILDPSLLASIEDVKAGSDLEMMLECLNSILRIGINCSSKSPEERMGISGITKELERIRARIGQMYI